MKICDEENCTNLKSIVLDNGTEKITLCSKHSKKCLAKLLKSDKKGTLKIVIPKRDSIKFKFNPSANNFVSAQEKMANKKIKDILDNILDDLWFKTKEADFLKNNKYMFE